MSDEINPTYAFILPVLFSGLWKREDVSAAAAPMAPAKKSEFHKAFHFLPLLPWTVVKF